jgi:hypothetical protein
MRKIFNRKVLIAILIFTTLFICVSLAYILVKRPAVTVPDLAPATYDLTIIPAPTSTLYALLASPTPFLLAAISSPTPAPGQIAIGVYVQPSTGGDGLRIHIAPSLNSALAFPSPAFDSEVFLVTKGPEQADGYTWWYLTASYDTSRAGWAAQDFLATIPSQ